VKGPGRHISMLTLAALTVASAVIPASAQVAQSSHTDGGDNVPAYVDNADRQPYYVNGVEYRPYAPEHRKQDSEAQEGAASSTSSADTHMRPYVSVAPAASSSSSSDTESDEDASAASSIASTSSASSQPSGPLKRPRYAVAIIQALDKVTAETIRFEAPIGKPIRYKGLIYTARACETTAADEPSSDVMAYLEVRTNPVAATSTTAGVRSREIFHGWSYASSPSLNPIEHPNYDAWVVGCAQPLPGV